MHSTESPTLFPPPSRSARAGSAVARTPLWLVAALILGAIFLWVMLTDPSYQVIFAAVIKGVGVTIQVTLISFALAIVLGLIVGLGRVSSRRLTYEAASFYVEIIRGVPMLVLLYYIGFAGAPALISAINFVGMGLRNAGILPGLGEGMASMTVRQMDFTVRVILALSIGYSAFLAEIFRGGIQSIERGQMEAARSLGMTYWQAMRHVILPQAIRRVLPPPGQRLHRHAQGLVTGVRHGRGRHHLPGQSLRRQHLQVLRDLQRGGLFVPGDDHRASAAGAGDREALEGGALTGGSVHTMQD